MKHLIPFVLSIASIALLTSCKDSSTVTGPGQATYVSSPITKDTLSGNIRGTMTQSHTYYIKDSITVLAGDTSFVQPGVTVIALKTSSVLFVRGALDAQGTQAAPILFSVPANLRTNVTGKGSWGGIRSDSATYLTLKWTQVEYTGGPDETGSPRATLKIVSNVKPTMIDIEDCWFKYGVDDGLRIQGGKGLILRNTLQSIGSDDGEAINIKVGFVGDVAHNVVWEPAGNCIKIETSTTDLSSITKVNVYNNTCVASGFRRLGENGYGVLVDANAQATVYNNVLVNNRYGFMVGPDADTANVRYGNNLFFGSVDSLNKAIAFYPADGVGKRQAGDLLSVNPMFANFDASQNALTANVDNNDYHLKPGSPALGKGVTFKGYDWQSPTSSRSKTIAESDLGAYTSGSGTNLH